MDKILTYKVFDGHAAKKYKVNVTHKIFGNYKMKCVINEIINDERVGIVVHGKEIFCYKNDDAFKLTEEKDRIIISDSLMEIIVENV